MRSITNVITRVDTVKIACGKEKREIMHDELDKNGYPAWCPLNKEKGINPTEDCQHSEKKPQEKCQIPPEMPDSIAGVPVSDLLFIAQIVGDNPRLIGQIKDGYAFGHAVGYKAGLELFEKKVHEAILKMNSEPLRFEQEGNFDFTKVKFEIPPYKQHDEVINMARLYGVPVFTPKVINVVNPSTDGDDKR
jgi:hypothetical protein